MDKSVTEMVVTKVIKTDHKVHGEIDVLFQSPKSLVYKIILLCP